MKQTVNFHGKEYETVGSRVNRFRINHPDWGIITEIVHVNDKSVIVQATVTDEAGRAIGMGHDEEKRSASGVNKDNALENAETSAIGRALAACGYAGTEYPSADEMRQDKQQSDPAQKWKADRIAEIDALKLSEDDRNRLLKMVNDAFGSNNRDKAIAVQVEIEAAQNGA